MTRQALLSGLAIIDQDFIKVSFTGCPDKLAGTLVFTSRHAIHAFAEYIHKGDSFSQRFSVYCLEDEMPDVLRNVGGIEIVSVAKDTAALANRIIADKQIKDLSFICGYREHELPDILRQHGIGVQEAKVYEIQHTGQPVKYAYRAVLFFSTCAAESFFQTNILAPGIPCFCSSAATAAIVKEHTENPVIAAAGPAQESMLESLKEFFKKKKSKRNDTSERRDTAGSRAGTPDK